MARLEYFDDLLNYWNELRDEAGGRVPTRIQFNPMMVPKLLPFMVMVERKSEEELIIRLVGTALDGMTNEPATGANVLERYGEAERALQRQLYRNILGQPAGAVIERLIQRPSDPCLQVRVMLLPLAGSDGTVRHVVGLIRARRHHADADPDILHDMHVDYIDLGFGVPAGE